MALSSIHTMEGVGSTRLQLVFSLCTFAARCQGKSIVKSINKEFSVMHLTSKNEVSYINPSPGLRVLKAELKLL